MFRRGMRRRRPRMVAPIVSQKHQLNIDQSYAGSDANVLIELYNVVGTDVLETGNNLHVGKKVFSVDVSINYVNSSPSTQGTYSWALIHLRQDQSIGTLFGTPATQWSVLGASNGRNQVIKSFMGVHGTEDANSVRYNMHIKIPKMWHRLRDGDSLVLVYNGSEGGTLSIGYRYKDYS